MGLFSKNKEEMPLPPMPPAPEVNNSSNEDKLVPPSMDTNSLSAPPIPGGSLEDIKSQVSLSSNSMSNSMPSRQEELSSSIEKPEEIEMPKSDLTTENNDDDSLFDFSELGLDDESPSISEERTEVEPSTNLDDLKFIKQSKTTKKEFETFFITTKQFKNLLEIVDSVKKRVKDASETHLRLMDIKAEEDIEYENLRKDFEFIEDKLYQVDNIIFEK